MDQGSAHVGVPERLLVRAQAILNRIADESDPVARLVNGEHSLAHVRQDLNNLIGSLTHFVGTPSPVPLVAMAGQYSGGKSSTINALTGVKSRAVGKHQSDTKITLVTDREEFAQVLSEQSRTDIRIGPPDVIASPFLGNKALIDTPGVNDPTKYIDLADNYLPICDVIVYVFADVPPGLHPVSRTPS